MRASRRTWAVWLASALGLGLVVAASAARPLARDVTRGQATLALLIVALALATPMGFVRLWRQRRVVVYALIGLGLLALLAFVLPFSPSLRPSPFGGQDGGRVSTTPIEPPARPRGGDDGSPLHWLISPWAAGALLALLGVAVAVALVVMMRRASSDPAVAPAPAPAPAEPEVTPEQLYSLLDDTLEDLRAEPDPRTAVIAAYFRMEKGLAGFGLKRRASEAPLEYLARALSKLSVSAPAAHRLTDLFERAKFSPTPVDDPMKAEAIEALEGIRDEVGAWAGAR